MPDFKNFTRATFVVAAVSIDAFWGKVYNVVEARAALLGQRERI